MIAFFFRPTLPFPPFPRPPVEFNPLGKKKTKIYTGGFSPYLLNPFPRELFTVISTDEGRLRLRVSAAAPRPRLPLFLHILLREIPPRLVLAEKQKR